MMWKNAPRSSPKFTLKAKRNSRHVFFKGERALIHRVPTRPIVLAIHSPCSATQLAKPVLVLSLQTSPRTHINEMHLIATWCLQMHLRMMNTPIMLKCIGFVRVRLLVKTLAFSVVFVVCACLLFWFVSVVTLVCMFIVTRVVFNFHGSFRVHGASNYLYSQLFWFVCFQAWCFELNLDTSPQNEQI